MLISIYQKSGASPGEFRMFASPSKTDSDYGVESADLFITLRNESVAVIYLFLSLRVSNLGEEYQMGLIQPFRPSEEHCLVSDPLDAVSPAVSSLGARYGILTQCGFRFRSPGVHVIAAVMIVTGPLVARSYGTRSTLVTFFGNELSSGMFQNLVPWPRWLPDVSIRLSLTITYPTSWILSRNTSPLPDTELVSNFKVAYWKRLFAHAFQPQGFTVTITWTVEDETKVTMFVNSLSEKATHTGTLLTPIAFSMRRRGRKSLQDSKRKLTLRDTSNCENRHSRFR